MRTFPTGSRSISIAPSTVLTGRPADSIAGYAPTERFDLIVMGTHGRTGLSHALLGSVAECVVRKRTVPRDDCAGNHASAAGETTGCRPFATNSTHCRPQRIDREPALEVDPKSNIVGAR